MKATESKKKGNFIWDVLEIKFMKYYFQNNYFKAQYRNYTTKILHAHKYINQLFDQRTKIYIKLKKKKKIERFFSKEINYGKEMKIHSSQRNIYMVPIHLFNKNLSLLTA